MSSRSRNPEFPSLDSYANLKSLLIWKTAIDKNSHPKFNHNSYNPPIIALLPSTPSLNHHDLPFGIKVFLISRYCYPVQILA
ncbi:hypothetical protein SPLC1_S531660 [Arthrospira platensis C1]|nr:hypothetical protein SPLC1_S531660 [Arthrospira platensis C1]